MNLIDMVHQIKERPGMYIGKLDLNYLNNFIDGFVYCLINNNLADSFVIGYNKYFNYFVQDEVVKKANNEIKKILKYNNGRSFISLIPLVELDSKKQIDMFFDLFDLFIKNLQKNYDFSRLERKYNPK